MLSVFACLLAFPGFIFLGLFSLCGAGKILDIVIWPRERGPRPPLRRAVIAALLDLSVAIVFCELLVQVQVQIASH